jgi:taurine dioxygenase
MLKQNALLSEASLAPLTRGEFGAELLGVQVADQASLDDLASLLRDLVGRHLVVLLRGQRMRPDQFSGLMTHFGPLLDTRRLATQAHHIPGADFIKVISNGTAEDGLPLGDGNSSAQVWHSDASPWEVPPGHNAMYCRETPEPAPRTFFVSMIDVYQSLPADLKERIGTLRVVHHQYPRHIDVEVARRAPSLPIGDRLQGRVHPLVRRHLYSSRPVLYLPTRRDSLVVGWSEADSRELLEQLWGYVENHAGIVALELQPDDIVIWDNTATQHSREGWPADRVRTVWHLGAEGEVPTPLFGEREKVAALS